MWLLVFQEQKHKMGANRGLNVLVFCAWCELKSGSIIITEWGLTKWVWQCQQAEKLLFNSAVVCVTP